MQVWSSSLIFAAPSNVPLKTCEIVNALPFSAFPLLSCFRTFNPIQGRTWVTLFFVTLFAVAAANVPAPLLLQSRCLVSSKYKPVEKKWHEKNGHISVCLSLWCFSREKTVRRQACYWLVTFPRTARAIWRISRNAVTNSSTPPPPPTLHTHSIMPPCETDK